VAGPQFSVWGIPVHVHASFALVALFGLASGSLAFALAWVAVVFVTTLVHELGHAVAFRAYGRQPTIALWGFGGLTCAEGPRLDRGRAIVVSLAGPVTEMALIGAPALLLTAAIRPASSTARELLDLTVWVGVGWAVVNLVPVLPLDGGRVVESLLEGAFGPRGWRAARVLSIALAAGGSLLAYARGFAFAALYGLFFISLNAADLTRVREARLAEEVRAAHAALDDGDLEAAATRARRLRAAARSPATREAAAELLAWVHLAAGRRTEAAEALAGLPAGAIPSRAVAATAMLADGLSREALAALAAGLRAGERPPNGLLARWLDDAGLVDELAAVALEARADAERARAGLALLADQLHRAGRFEAAARLSVRLAAAGGPEVALHRYNAACSLARAGQLRDALRELAAAVAAGFSDAALMGADPDLAGLRTDPEFARLLEAARDAARSRRSPTHP
jgi:Zn-dependent protease